MAYNDYYSRTRPNHGPTQLTKEEFVNLPLGSKVRMHHATGSGMVVTLLAFEELVYVSEWNTEHGVGIYRHHYTDSGLDPYDTCGWNPSNWVSLEEIGSLEVHTVFEPPPPPPSPVRVLVPIRWQEVGF